MPAWRASRGLEMIGGLRKGEKADLEAELGVVDFAAGFDEFGEANAEDVGGGRGLSRHGDGGIWSRQGR